MTLQEFAKDHLASIQEIYIKNPSLLLEHYEIERKTSEEYNGRQLLELIQNADDAAIKSANPKVLIYLNESTLIVANNGESFSLEGLDSILHCYLSPKF